MKATGLSKYLRGIRSRLGNAAESEEEGERLSKAQRREAAVHME